MLDDFYGKEGCCLTCEDYEKPERRGWNGVYGEGCLCYDCMCRSCVWYEVGYCTLAVTWEDYENMARRIQKEAIEKWNKTPTLLKATFSNGRITKTVYYSYAADIPIKIIYRLEKGYPYRYRTLLLKKVEEHGEARKVQG